MRESLKQKIIQVYQTKAKKKRQCLGHSFYTFFAPENDSPEVLMEVGKW